MKKQKKEFYWEKLKDLVLRFKNVVFVTTDNISSKQISKIRKDLRNVNAHMIMGKNTLIHACLAEMKNPDSQMYTDDSTD